MEKLNKTVHTEKGRTLTELVLRIFHINGQILSGGDDLTREFNLTSALWQIMGAVSDAPLPMAQIARKMGLARQSVRRSAIILEKKGFVRFMDNPDHKRANLLTLTVEGMEILERVRGKEAEMVNRLSNDMDIVDLKTAIRIINQLSENLSNNMTK